MARLDKMTDDIIERLHDLKLTELDERSITQLMECFHSDFSVIYDRGLRTNEQLVILQQRLAQVFKVS